MTTALLLEDDPERIKAFKQRFLEEGWAYTVTTMARECIDQLRGGRRFDVVFLDHDLGGETFADPLGENTGSAVARWMAEHMASITTVIIHSFNAPAAEAMRSRLGDHAFYLPGCWSKAGWGSVKRAAAGPQEEGA